MKQLGKLLKRYFIPHEDNDYKPHILQKSAALGILFLIMTTFTAVNIQSLVLVSSDWYASAVLPAVLIDLTNSNRENESLGKLERSPVLDEAARMKAEDMASKEYFAHDSPEGLTPWYWFGKAGYDYAYAGENLAVHFSDSGEVVKAWMHSPGHRANIMNGHYTEIGIGTALGHYKGAPTIFVVQLFGQPLTIAERAKVIVATALEDKTFEARLDATVAGAADEAAVDAVHTGTTTADATAVSLGEGESGDEVPSMVAPLSPKHIPAPSLAQREVIIAAPVSRPAHITLFDVATVSPFIASGLLSADRGVGNADMQIGPMSTPLGQASSRPHLVLSVIYSVLAALVFVALMLSIVIEWRRREPVQMLYGAGLLVALWVALSVHTVLVTGALVI